MPRCAAAFPGPAPQSNALQHAITTARAKMSPRALRMLYPLIHRYVPEARPPTFFDRHASTLSLAAGALAAAAVAAAAGFVAYRHSCPAGKTK